MKHRVDVEMTAHQCRLLSAFLHSQAVLELEERAANAGLEVRAQWLMRYSFYPDRPPTVRALSAVLEWKAARVRRPSATTTVQMYGPQASFIAAALFGWAYRDPDQFFEVLGMDALGVLALATELHHKAHGRRGRPRKHSAAEILTAYELNRIRGARSGSALERTATQFKVSEDTVKRARQRVRSGRV